MTKRTDGRQHLFALAAETFEIIASERKRADQLVAEDGSIDARREAKIIRMRMTKWERSTQGLLAYCDADYAHEVALAS